MHLIKKYSNRKLYDTKNKTFVTMDDIADMIISGEEIQIIDNDTGDDLTAAIASQILGRKTGDKETNGIPTNVIFQLLRKGGGGLLDYTRKYIDLWQNVLTMADDEIDNLVNSYIKNKEISSSEGMKLKEEIKSHSHSLKSWISGNIETSISSVMDKMNVVKAGQWQTLVTLVEDLIGQVSDLEVKLENIENQLKEKTKKSSEKPQAKASPKPKKETL